MPTKIFKKNLKIDYAKEYKKLQKQRIKGRLQRIQRNMAKERRKMLRKKWNLRPIERLLGY